MKSLSNIIIVGTILTSITAIVISQQLSPSFHERINSYIDTNKEQTIQPSARGLEDF
jgi:hypothetical protein